MSKQSSSDNIRVVVRFRPPNRRELEEKVKARLFIDIIEGKQLILRSEDVCFGEKKFNFDHVFNHDTTQEQFYKIACQSVIDDVLNGFNGTIFAYGQTGAGKSYSMMGILEDPEKFGLIPRAAHAIFDTIEKGSSNVEFKICCSYVEIYNEKLQCLLDPTKKNLQIHENPDKGVYIKDLTQEYVSQVDDIYELLEVGQNNRVISFTQMNAVSSRSHSVFIISIEQTDKETGSMKSAQFNLVDLAGSEKVAKTGATGQTLKEAQNINKSLSTLGKCIYALCEGSSHVPFRDSKLTRILQNGLGGNSKVLNNGFSGGTKCDLDYYDMCMFTASIQLGRNVFHLKIWRACKNYQMCSKGESAKECQGTGTYGCEINCTTERTQITKYKTEETDKTSFIWSTSFTRRISQCGRRS